MYGVLVGLHVRERAAVGPVPQHDDVVVVVSDGAEHGAARVEGEQRDRPLVAPREDERPRQLPLRLWLGLGLGLG